MEKSDKAFTLIELLAVIIILAVIALIATPIVLNIIGKARDKANFLSAQGLLEAADLYYSESHIDKEKMTNVVNQYNIYREVTVQGNKPVEGQLHANEDGLTALAVILDKKCYMKRFNGELKITDEKCDLGFIELDKTQPTVTFKYNEVITSKEWYKTNVYVNVEVIDNESGPRELDYCITSSDTCTPNTNIKNSKISPLIEETNGKRVCVIGQDNQDNKSKLECSDIVRVDKTYPSFTGISDITIQKGNSMDLRSGVTVSDTISGINGMFTVSPSSVNTSVAGTTNVVYSVGDKAGNIKTISRKIIVDAHEPQIVFNPLGSTINSNGWSNKDFYVEVNLIDLSGLGIKEGKWCITQDDICTPNAVISGATISPLVSTESNNNRICVQATDNNNKQTQVICSDSYKLDKTEPSFIVNNFAYMWGTMPPTASFITHGDLSGYNYDTFVYSPILTNETAPGTYEITYKMNDYAGNLGIYIGHADVAPTPTPPVLPVLPDPPIPPIPK